MDTREDNANRKWKCNTNLFMSEKFGCKQVFTKGNTYKGRKYTNDYVELVDDEGDSHIVYKGDWIKYFEEVDFLSINKKMKDIATAVSNICSKDLRSVEQNVIVARVTCYASKHKSFIDRYKFISEQFDSYEEVILRKYNIKK